MLKSIIEFSSYLTKIMQNMLIFSPFLLRLNELVKNVTREYFRLGTLYYIIAIRH